LDRRAVPSPRADLTPPTPLSLAGEGGVGGRWRGAFSASPLSSRERGAGGVRSAGGNTIEHTIPNGDGWHLSLFQTWDDRRFVPGRRPVLIVPGYGMNSFIFSFHPRGLSLEGYLAHAGFEVWRVDMRGQGRSRSVGGGDEYGLEDLALTDLG